MQGSDAAPLRVQLLQTTLINQCVMLGYRLGVQPETLANWYYHRDSKQQTALPRGASGMHLS